MRNEYKKYSAAFKADIALLALEKHSIEEISSMYNVSYEFVYKCKSELLNNACTIFGGNSEKNKYTTEDVRELYDNIKKFIDGVDNFNYEIKQLRKDSSTPSEESATKNNPGYGPSNKLKKTCRPGSNCRVPDDRLSQRSYPLLASRELIKQLIQEKLHGHQAA